jgi:hypothetical protein
MDLKLLLACLGPDTNINSKGKSFQNTKFIENIMSGISKDATQMPSGRTASQCLLQMAADTTGQNVKEIYPVKNSFVKFYEKEY